MNGESNWRGVSFGLGALAASLGGWILGTVNHDATWDEYLFWTLVPFGVVFGLSVVAWHIPAVYAMVWYHITELDKMKLQRAQIRQAIHDLSFNSQATGRPTIDVNETQWHTFHVEVATFVRDTLKGDAHYKGGLDVILKWHDWHAWADGLVKDGVLENIYQGGKTDWAAGWNVDRLIGKLDSGWTPTHPNEAAPTLKQS